ncbi:IclR family transcriptional regulator [Rhodococcus pyridinivorans KG-16]|uniref:IclR family transcriptional regulator n=1 Tax=Rhodococcus pyridinivorans KG-16 TaxID=1441730 RepID=A0A0V9UEB3_9NOCA|nr:helix-turn-helix domain-containing protein [Rhodococcus pyridinivorans]KSZ56378.1 IclR family transcriptional regulator [Rhodococcus pyridinivorans KG-16]
MTRTSPQTERIVMLMELLAEEPGAGRSLADIARHLGVAKATCYPMVVALTEAGWLIRHPSRKTYQLGPALIAIGQAADQAADVVDLARSVMHRLADLTHLACVAFVPSGSDLVVAEIVQPIGGRRGTLGLRLGDKVLLAPPLGAGLAAWYPSDRLDEWYTVGAQALDEDADSLRARYEPILTLIRNRGFAVECLQQQERSLADAVSALRGYGSGGNRSTVALREARRLLSADVLVGAVELQMSYQPISVNSVVFGPDGGPVMVLCVVDAPAPMSGAATLELGDLVRDAAAEVTAAVHGRPPAH